MSDKGQSKVPAAVGAGLRSGWSCSYITGTLKSISTLYKAEFIYMDCTHYTVSLLIFVVLGLKAKASCMLSERATVEL